MGETAKIAAALAAFQAEVPVVRKSQTAEVPTKAGGRYSYTFANLANVGAAAYPLLTKHGLAFSACPERHDHGYELVGWLLHTSGESLRGALPIQGNTAQEIGSSITYGRRYLLGSMTGIVTDDDDDGALASRAKPAAAKAQRPAEQQTAGVTADQLKKIGASMRDLGMTDRAAALAYVSDVVGRQVGSRNELTKAQAHSLIEALEKDRAASADPPDPHDSDDPWSKP